MSPSRRQDFRNTIDPSEDGMNVAAQNEYERRHERSSAGNRVSQRLPELRGSAGAKRHKLHADSRRNDLFDGRLRIRQISIVATCDGSSKTRLRTDLYRGTRDRKPD